MRIRHPLDFSPPRLSDLPPDDAKMALLSRADRAREDWLRSRQPQPIVQRLLSILRGLPPSPGADASRPHSLPPAECGAAGVIREAR